MTKAIPLIRRYMTTCPHSIGSDQTLSRASSVMSDLKIRHLPVLEGGRLVGLLSQRDIQMVETLAGVDPEKVLVSDAMSSNVYSVSPDDGLDAVVAEMAEHKYGSAVVLQNEKVVGIFTTVDVCLALAELLRTRLA
jgi:acetoin utilization protein AcuB